MAFVIAIYNWKLHHTIANEKDILEDSFGSLARTV